MSLGGRTWTDVAGPRTLLVPVGSLEQHGPHLPLDTDTRIACAVAHRAADGASGEHEAFPGTVSIGHEALRGMLVELGRSAERWAHRLVFVNGHGGNLPTVPDAVRLLRSEGRDAAWWACALPGGDAHAGRTETSLLLALAPELVRLDAAQPGNTAPLTELLPRLRASGVAAVSPNGVLGDPTGATAQEGERLLAELVGRLRTALTRWAPDERGLLRA